MSDKKRCPQCGWGVPDHDLKCPWHGADASDALLDKVRERIAAHLSNGDFAREPFPVTLDSIMREVETGQVLARREGYVRGRVQATPGLPDAHEMDLYALHAAFAFPLPPRTRQVLREEPVPGTGWPLYRVRGGLLEWTIGQSAGSSFDWRRVGTVGGGDFEIMAHALDLHANPYRREQVPGDESDPWGERT